MFWTLLSAVWAALNAVFLGNDLFNLYVALEILTFAAVPLVCLDGSPATLTAALRYLLFALLGSAFYLLGAVLLYGAYGTLDIVLLVRPGPRRAGGLGGGFIDDRGASRQGGALSSPSVAPARACRRPGPGKRHSVWARGEGAVFSGRAAMVQRHIPQSRPWRRRKCWARSVPMAIIFGSILALRQVRLKLLIAYSTVAQIGYLFLIFPLASAPQTGSLWGTAAWTGGILQAVSHACAKAAMFMAAGLIAEALGHDRLAGLGGVARALPVTVFALALGGMSLMGLPPSGGFVAKALLLTAAVEEGQWWWAPVILVGGLLAGGYVFIVLTRTLSDPAESLILSRTVSWRRQAIVAAVALSAVLLGFVPLRPSELLQIGRPEIAATAPR